MNNEERIPLDRQILIMSAEDLRRVLDEFVEKIYSGRKETEDDKEMIGTKEACRILGGISARTMQNYRNARLFNFKKVGPHKALYYRKEIEAFRDANIVKSRSCIKSL